MINIKVIISGVSPLICNKFTDKAALAATTGISSNNMGEPLSPKEQAEEKLYLDKGKPCIPQPNILASIIEGGRFHKIKNRSVTTMQKSMIPSCFDIKGTMLPIKTKGWEVDERPVRIPATGGRILAYRPKFNDWRLEFDATLNPEIVSLPLMRQIIDDAGTRIGLGDYRPDRKGPFGKYKVDKWQKKRS
tara:strand:- start:1865 stop:2434 length:570 start_codon:yes stop_codon:yes gene_type:complete